ncbi:hypothetical protein C6P42_003441 [Pichia californica]|nr:hypothetical protein C6P42_003441 [[Candida] californica]
MTRNVSISYESILQNPGPFTDSEYEYKSAKEVLETSHILVIGAGGLGCEILKDLALSGIKRISVIDMDTIELTNLNRQFLFKEENVGKSKSIIASKVIKDRIKGNLEILPYFNKIQDFNDEFYMQFDMIICGLDSIEARRWINNKILHLAIDKDIIIPIIDGGTEGFQGSVKLIIPTYSACFECYMPLIPEKITYPLCTLASTPRLPEHCIEWAHQLEWNRVYPGIKFDYDDMNQVEKMYELAKIRAIEFGIEGITKTKTLGVIKNIIPAIASTNSIISGQCCNEVFKFLTGCNPNMKDSLFYNGENGVLCEPDQYLKLPNCPVCSKKIERINLSIEDSDITIEQLAIKIKEIYTLDNPVIMIGNEELYNFKFISETNKTNSLTVREYFSNSEKVSLNIVDKNIENVLNVEVIFS